MWPVFPFILRPGPHPHSPPPEDNNDHGGIRSANFASCLVGGHCGHSAKSSAGKMRQKQRQFEHLGLFVNGRGRKTRPDQLIGKWIEYTQFLSLTRFTSFAVDGGHGTLLTVSYANDRRLNSCKWICNSFLLVSFTRSLFFPSFFLSLMIYVHVCLSVRPCLSTQWAMSPVEMRAETPLEEIPFNSKTNSSTGWRGPGFRNESVRDFHPDSCLWTPIILDGMRYPRSSLHYEIAVDISEFRKKKEPSHPEPPIIYSCT